MYATFNVVSNPEIYWTPIANSLGVPLTDWLIFFPLVVIPGFISSVIHPLLWPVVEICPEQAT